MNNRQITKIILIPIFQLILIFISTTPILAQSCPYSTNNCGHLSGVSWVPGCPAGQSCIVNNAARSCSCMTTPTGGTTAGSGPFGTITNPLPTSSLTPGGGLIQILNNILRLVFLAGGIFAFIKVLAAGIKFIDAGGDPKAIEQAVDSIWQSLVGVIIIISSIAIAALIGLLLFGDVTAILSPKIYGPG